jgi:hypothetical protein
MSAFRFRVAAESTVVLPEAVLGRLAIYEPSAAGPLGSGPFSAVEQDRSHILLRRGEIAR